MKARTQQLRRTENIVGQQAQQHQDRMGMQAHSTKAGETPSPCKRCGLDKCPGKWNKLCDVCDQVSPYRIGNILRFPEHKKKVDEKRVEEKKPPLDYSKAKYDDDKAPAVRVHQVDSDEDPDFDYEENEKLMAYYDKGLEESLASMYAEMEQLWGEDTTDPLTEPATEPQ